ncbi:MAG: hypothetical protein WCJ30_01060, partial [Deltaproteobacteria bacterium]
FGLAAIAPACGPGFEGAGSLEVRVHAEESITGGLPAAPPAGGFEDGWSLVYERYLIDVGHVRIASSRGDAVAVPAAFSEGDRVFDLTSTAGHSMFLLSDTPALRYDRVSYRTVPASAATTFEDTVSSADRTAMLGASTWITAVATRGAERVRIDWRFTEAYEYHDCEGPPDRPGLGAVVSPGARTTLNLTIHGDHWFWQSLGVDGSPVRFDPIAHADTSLPPYRGNGDGETSRDELAAVLLADVPVADGEFNPAGRPVSTLGDFMRWTTGTNGHIDGDGVCVSRTLVAP